MNLQVLLFEDAPEDMAAFRRDFPPVFNEAGHDVVLHPADTFEKAAEMIDDRSRRFDLILSDTYRGEHKHGDAVVIGMVEKYRGARFCPMVVFGASPKPSELTLGSFVIWADKTEPQGIEKAIRQMLKTGVPQIARLLHDELDLLAGSYLWGFLESNWSRLELGGHADEKVLTRLIRRRAALQLAEISFTEQGAQQIADVSGGEIYIYPPLNDTHYSLGEIIRKKEDKSDVRVILTPHCYLAIQQNQTVPRAEYVITVKTVPIATVLGTNLQKTKNEKNAKKRLDLIRKWITPPSHRDVGKPEGRYWYLPQFLEIPDLYCDFLQVESIPHSRLESEYEELAVLSPPFAESLQACFGAFHGSVGIPDVRADSVARSFS